MAVRAGFAAADSRAAQHLYDCTRYVVVVVVVLLLLLLLVLLVLMSE